MMSQGVAFGFFSEILPLMERLDKGEIDRSYL